MNQLRGLAFVKGRGDTLCKNCSLELAAGVSGRIGSTRILRFFTGAACIPAKLDGVLYLLS